MVSGLGLAGAIGGARPQVGHPTLSGSSHPSTLSCRVVEEIYVSSCSWVGGVFTVLVVVMVVAMLRAKTRVLAAKLTM